MSKILSLIRILVRIKL